MAPPLSFSRLRGMVACAGTVLVLAVGTAGVVAAADPQCPPAGQAAMVAASWAAVPAAEARPGTVIQGESALPPTTGACHDAGMARLQSAIASTITAGGVVLLGEVHDNGNHHILRGHLVTEAIRATGRRPVVVMEHFRSNHTFVLDRFEESGRAGGADKVFEVTQWAKSGWPDQALFRPLIAAILAADLKIRPADPPKEMVRLVGRQGIETMTDEEFASLGLSVPLPAPLQDGLLTELEASHCGLMPKTVFGKLADAQRYRDAHQARAAQRVALSGNGAILLAGNGHVRKDRAVPWHLHRIASSREVLSVMLIEVEGSRQATAYMPRGPDGRPAADFVVLTPRAARPDPCVAMREMFSRHRK